MLMEYSYEEIHINRKIMNYSILLYPIFHLQINNSPSYSPNVLHSIYQCKNYQFNSQKSLKIMNGLCFLEINCELKMITISNIFKPFQILRDRLNHLALIVFYIN